MKPETLIDPLVSWATTPAEQTRLKMLDGHPPIKLPREGDVITAPFIVDPETDQPVPVRVLQIQTRWSGSRHILAVVVVRDQPH